MAKAAESRIVKCAMCGAQNRVVAAAATAKVPVCGKCGKTLPTAAAKPVIVTDVNFGETVESSPLPVLLDLWAAWCGPCRMVGPIIDQLAGELSGRVLVGKLDVDANPRVASRFGVQSIPTLLIFKNGREVDRLIGAQPKAAILQQLQRHL